MVNHVLISKIGRLNSRQLELIKLLINEILSLSVDKIVVSKSEDFAKAASKKEEEDRPTDSYISQNKVHLQLNDCIKVLNTRTSGRAGDVRYVIKFNKKFVSIKLDRNSKITLRSAKNLYYLNKGETK